MKKLIISSIFAMGFSSMLFAATDNMKPALTPTQENSSTTESHKHMNHHKKAEHDAHEMEHKAHKMEQDAHKAEHKMHKKHKDNQHTESSK